MTKFTDLNLDAKVLKAVAETGYDTPTPIQAGAIAPSSRRLRRNFNNTL